MVAVTVLTLITSPLIAAQGDFVGHGSFRETWVYWVGLIAVLVAFAWAALASTEWKIVNSRDVEAKLLKSLLARGEIDQQGYNVMLQELNAQTREQQ